MDPDEVKHELYSTKVMEYREETCINRTRSSGRSVGGGDFTGTTASNGVGGVASGKIREDANSWNEFLAHSDGGSSTWTESESESETESSVLIPVLGKELSHVQFRSLEEQLFRAMAVLFDQEQRQGVARLVGMNAPVSLYAPTVDKMPDRDGLEQVLFFFECTRCHARRAFFENCDEYRVKTAYCEQCQGEMKSKFTHMPDGIIITKSCTQCGVGETETLEKNCESEKADDHYIADRQNVCLSEEDGQEYVASRDSLVAWQRERNGREQLKPFLEEIAKLKRLTIIEAQNLMTRSLKKIGFSRVEFDQPTVKIDVQVGFFIQDAKPGRDERESIRALRHQFSQMLGDTNWKLMTGSVIYKLGILSGQMRGLETEQELIEMIRIRLKTRKSKV